MKVTFIGGGSLRLLPLFRGMFKRAPQMWDNGEIRLYDLKQDRAEAVATLVQACPEFSNVKNCKVFCPSSMEDALQGIDALYLSMAAERDPSLTMARIASYDHSIYPSDQLSLDGAFLSLRLGGLILSIAKKMEVLCPKALMLIFANPVSVYSYMVNTYTKIQALGICGGFNNHRWDLTRMMFGKDECDEKWNVVAAGVNHLSYILRGDYDGEDLYGSLCPRYLTDDWKCLPGQELACESLYKSYRQYGTLIFSTECDGIAQIFPEAALKHLHDRFLQDRDSFDPVVREAEEKKRVEKRFADFIEQSKHPETVNWTSTDPREKAFYGLVQYDITLPVFKAVAGLEKMRIVASRPNYGVIRDLPYSCAVEYTMDLYKNEITPVEDQYIPRPFYGLTASLSEYQTLLADSIAKHDNHIFANALATFPQHIFTDSKRKLILELFDIYSDVDPYMLEAKKYFM
ncbi:MAG: hypothetical protein IKB16_07075 [Lentisphaeria bacterium]|nr:hypothetical protein [Lentisphaeria bacterium]